MPHHPIFPYSTLFRSEIVQLDRGEVLCTQFARTRTVFREVSRLRGNACQDRSAGRSTVTVTGPARSASRKTVRVRRSEEHTSELQSRPHLVCRLLLEK